MPEERLHNLPTPPTPLIGRERLVEASCRHLRDPQARLLTLTGAGGCGKTRLALEVARALLPAFPDGVRLVELDALADGALVPQAIADTLDLQAGVGRTLRETLVAHLQPKALLLVLDNCEHLIDTCAELADHLLAACPVLRILATSREPLRIPAEVAWRVPSLEAPDPRHLPPIQEIAGFPAVQLFLARARAAQPDTALTTQNAPAVADVCARLDGLPLALELAAARLRAMAVEQLAARLDDVFRLLGEGSRTAPSRQQTLRATLDWSHDLLSEPERATFRRLAVCAGGFDLEAAEAVCAGGGIEPSAVLDLLARLVDKSLVQAQVKPRTVRYRLLGPIRQYAREWLAAIEEGTVTQAGHAAYFLGLAEEEGWGSRRTEYFDRLEDNLDNLRAVLEWSRAESDRVEIGLRLAGALFRFWDGRGHLGEGRAWLAELLRLPAASGRTPGRAKALFAAAWLAILQEGDAAADSVLEESLAIWHKLGDQRGLGWAVWLAGVAQRHRDPAAGRILAERSLTIARSIGDTAIAHWSRWLHAVLTRTEGDYERAVSLFEEFLAESRALGDVEAVGFALHSLGHVAWLQGDYERAATRMRESLVLRRQLNDWNILDTLEGLAWVASAQRQVERAVRLCGAAETLREAAAAALVGRRRASRERRLDEARAAIGESAFAAALAGGRAMSLDQAVAYALEAATPPAATAPREESPVGLLSRREREVAALLARGLTNRQIAEALVVTTRTAEAHVASILAKLDLATRAQAAAWAVEHGLSAAIQP